MCHIFYALKLRQVLRITDEDVSGTIASLNYLTNEMCSCLFVNLQHKTLNVYITKAVLRKRNASTILHPIRTKGF